jgi:hypothetical protein
MTNWSSSSPVNVVIDLMTAFPTLPLRDAVGILDGTVQYKLNDKGIQIS